MKLSLFFISIFLVMNSFVLMNETEISNKAKFKKQSSDLYEISYHIQGRIKSAILLKPLFSFTLLQMKEFVLGKEIHVKILSETEFELIYEINSKSIRSKGFFNSENENNEMKYQMNLNMDRIEYVDRSKVLDFFIIINYKN